MALTPFFIPSKLGPWHYGTDFLAPSSVIMEVLKFAGLYMVSIINKPGAVSLVVSSLSLSLLSRCLFSHNPVTCLSSFLQAVVHPLGQVKVDNLLHMGFYYNKSLCLTLFSDTSSLIVYTRLAFSCYQVQSLSLSLLFSYITPSLLL